MKARTAALFWAGLYLLLAAFPLLVLLIGPLPGGGGRWWDFAMGLGFAGLAVMGLQFVMTARFRRATAPFGIDIIYYFHRWIAVGGLGLILAHCVILRVLYPDALGPVNPRDASMHMTAGRAALALFVLIVATSLWRKQFGIEYDRWRWGHALMAVAAVVLAVTHIEGVGYYTNAGWKQVVWGAYSMLWIVLLAYVRVVKPWMLLRRPYTVVDVRAEHGHAWTLTLEPAGSHSMKFRPGQFAWLTLGASPFAAREHPFSFSGSAEEPRKLEFTIRELGDFTRTIGDTKAGETAYVDGPYGVFSTDFHPDASGFVFVAGGVGIAPIMSMLRTLAGRAETRPLRLVYGNRRWDDVLFREELERLGTALDLRVVHVLEEPPMDWSGEVGAITPLMVAKAIPETSPAPEFFLCGPRAMSDVVQRGLVDRGVPLGRIHFELFDMV